MTQVIINASDDLGVRRNETGTYPPTTTAFTNVGVQEDYAVRDTPGGSAYRVWNLLLAFDTSVIPDSAVVYSAALRMYIIERASADGLSLVAEYFSWVGDATDWTNAAGSNAHTGTLIAPLTLLADADFALTNLTNISTTAATKFRLSLSQRAADAAPTGFNYLGIGMIENTTVPESRLVVNYATPARSSPANIVSQTNLSGAVSVIQDDPDSPDTNWLTAP